jgi:hypothetical protein
MRSEELLTFHLGSTVLFASTCEGEISVFQKFAPVRGRHFFRLAPWPKLIALRAFVPFVPPTLEPLPLLDVGSLKQEKPTVQPDGAKTATMAIEVRSRILPTLSMTRFS